MDKNNKIIAVYEDIATDKYLSEKPIKETTSYETSFYTPNRKMTIVKKFYKSNVDDAVAGQIISQLSVKSAPENDKSSLTVKVVNGKCPNGYSKVSEGYEVVALLSDDRSLGICEQTAPLAGMIALAAWVMGSSIESVGVFVGACTVAGMSILTNECQSRVAELIETQYLEYSYDCTLLA